MEVTGFQMSICEKTGRGRASRADLREINRLLRSMVVRRKVLGRVLSAVVRPAIDGPVLEDAGCDGCSRALSSFPV